MRKYLVKNWDTAAMIFICGHGFVSSNMLNKGTNGLEEPNIYQIQKHESFNKKNVTYKLPYSVQEYD